MKSNRHAGQFKLKGKKSMALSCGCCTVENWKEDCRKKEIRKEIRDYLSSGGLFNPEAMEHEKVRDLLIKVGNWMDEDKGYEIGTQEGYEEFVRKRNE